MLRSTSLHDLRHGQLAKNHDLLDHVHRLIPVRFLLLQSDHLPPDQAVLA